MLIEIILFVFWTSNSTGYTLYFSFIGNQNVLDGFLGLLWLKLVIKTGYLICIRQKKKTKWSCGNFKIWAMFNFTLENEPLLLFSDLWFILKRLRFVPALIWPQEFNKEEPIFNCMFCVDRSFLETGLCENTNIKLRFTESTEFWHTWTHKANSQTVCKCNGINFRH